MLDADQKEVIALFYKQEMLLARLYQIFAGEFPEYGAFWKDLAGEEITHAEWVKQLYQAGRKGSVGFREGKIKSPALKTYIGHLEKAIEKAEQGGFKLKSAMAYTLDYEKSLIERNTFTHFESTEESWQETMRRLQKETQKHVQRVMNMIKKVEAEPGS